MFAGLGRTCFRHRWVVLAVWALIAVVGLAVGSRVTGRMVSQQGASATESVVGAAKLAAASPYGAELDGLVDHVDVASARVQAAVTAAAEQMRTVPGVAVVRTWYDTHDPRLKATDGRATMIVANEVKDLTSTEQKSVRAGFRAALETIPPAVPGATVAAGGTPFFFADINKQVERDTRFGEAIAIGVSLVVLVFVFGGFVAATLPLLAAVATIAGALLVLLGYSYLTDLDPNVLSVTSVLGLGLSIDYSLLVVNRLREERGRGLDDEPAIVRTVSTAGRTITFSALTVAVALSALLLFHNPIDRDMGAAGIAVVLLALAAGLTLTPALLSVFEHRVKLPSRPPPDTGRFYRLARLTQRHAVPVVVVLVPTLLALAVPFLRAQFTLGGAQLLPASAESRVVLDAQTRFPGGGSDPIVVVAQVPQTQMDAYARQVAALPGVVSVTPVPGLSGLSGLYVVPDGPPQGDQARALVAALRGPHAPPFPAWVTGSAAFLVDNLHDVTSHLPWALALIAVATFVLLFLMTGSVLIPIKALVMTVLSLGASFGALVLVFQDGWLHRILGFDPPGAIQTFIPVLVFVFAFGLSMDYEVFLISRIKELYDAGASNDDAVAVGLQRTGRIITSAALLIVIVFAGFAAGRMVAVKEIGIALAIAVTIDATVVRLLLVPATMTLLRDLNWWAPRPLRRLHARLGLYEGEPDAPVEQIPTQVGGR